MLEPTTKNIDNDNFFLNSVLSQRNDLLMYFCGISLNRFIWEFKENVIATQRLIESELFLKGYVGCIKIGDFYYIVPITTIKYNYCYEITEFMVQREQNGTDILPYELFGKAYKVDNKNVFVCYNSFDWFMTYSYILRQIDRLAQTQCIYYSLLNKMQQPYTILTTDKTVLNSKLQFQESKLKDIVYTDNADNIKVLDLQINVQYVDKLQSEIENLFTEIHGIIGVTYCRFPKRERVITDEMLSSKEIKELFSTGLLQSRVNFCEKVGEDLIKVVSTLDSIQYKDSKTQEFNSENENFNGGNIENGRDF